MPSFCDCEICGEDKGTYDCGGPKRFCERCLDIERHHPSLVQWIKDVVRTQIEAHESKYVNHKTRED